MSILVLALTSSAFAARPPVWLPTTTTGPYIPCEVFGQVWDGHRCVESTRNPFRTDGNALATGHNAALAADYEVQGEGEVTVDDAARAFEAMGKGTQPPTPGCDPLGDPSTTLRLFEQVGDFSDPAEGLRALLAYDVALGAMSPELAEQFLAFQEAAESGKMSGPEVLVWEQEELDSGRWEGADLEWMTDLLAVSRASSDYWGLGGTSTSAAKWRWPTWTQVGDALGTVGWAALCIYTEQLEFLEHAPHAGALVSELVSSHRAAPATPHTLDWSAVTTPFGAEEAVLLEDGTTVRLSLDVSRDGLAVQASDADGKLLADTFLTPDEASALPDDLAKGRPGATLVWVWTPWGWLLFSVERFECGVFVTLVG